MSTKGKKQNVTIWIDKKIVAKVDAIARSNRRSRNYTLTTILESIIKLPKSALRHLLQIDTHRKPTK